MLLALEPTLAHGVGIRTATGATSGAGNVASWPFTIPADSGVTADDVGYAIAQVSDSSITLSIAGWTAISGPIDNAAVNRAYLFRRDMDGTEAGTTFTVLPSSGTWRGNVAVVVVANGSIGGEVVVQASDLTVDAVIDGIAITPSGDDAMQLHFGASRFGVTTTPRETPPADWSKIVEISEERAASVNFTAWINAKRLTGQNGVAQTAQPGSYSFNASEHAWMVTIPLAGASLSGSQSDSAPATDTVSRSVTTARAMSDTAAAVDAVVRGLGLGRSNPITIPALLAGRAIDGYWRHGDTAGSAVMADSSGNAHDGTYTGTPTLGVAGLLTGDPVTALALTGVNTKYGTIPFGAWMNRVNDIGFGQWFATTQTGLMYMFQRWESTGTVQLWGLDLNNTLGQLRAYVGMSGGSGNVILSTTGLNLNDGARHFAYAKWSAADGNLRIFIDGVQSISVAATGTLRTSSQDAYVGRRGGVTTNFFNGTEQDTFVGPALSDDDILSIWQQGTTGGDRGNGTDGTSGSVSTGGVSRSTSDSAPATDTNARTSTRSRAISDAGSGTDAVVRGLVVARPVSDSAPATDAVTRTSARARAQNDSAPAADAASRALAEGRAASDTAPATDAVTRTSSRSRSESDTAGGTDTSARGLAQTRTPGDTATTSDSSSSSSGGSSSRSISDAAPATDATTRSSTRSRAESDAAGGTDATSRQSSRARAVSDTAPATDAVTRTSTRSRSTTDAAPATDATVRTRTMGRSLADNAAAVDAIARLVALGRSVADAAPATDSASAYIPPVAGTPIELEATGPFPVVAVTAYGPIGYRAAASGPIVELDLAPDGPHGYDLTPTGPTGRDLVLAGPTRGD